MKAPKCPGCGRELERVWEVEHSTYIWQPFKNQYEEKSLGDLFNECPHCNSNLYDLFPDGVCNYSREE